MQWSGPVCISGTRYPLAGTNCSPRGSFCAPICSRHGEGKLGQMTQLLNYLKMRPVACLPPSLHSTWENLYQKHSIEERYVLARTLEHTLHVQTSQGGIKWRCQKCDYLCISCINWDRCHDSNCPFDKIYFPFIRNLKILKPTTFISQGDRLLTHTFFVSFLQSFNHSIPQT